MSFDFVFLNYQLLYFMSQKKMGGSSTGKDTKMLDAKVLSPPRPSSPPPVPVYVVMHVCLDALHGSTCICAIRSMWIGSSYY